MIYTISNKNVSAKINSLGAELISLVVLGKEMMWQSPSESFWSKHAPLLFPVCGRLKDGKYTYRGKSYNMTAHGFISLCELALTEICEDSVTLSLSSNDKSLEIYPFPFTFTIQYSLTENGIVSRVKVENQGDYEMPYMFGWHPGFALMCEGGVDINDYRIEFEGKPEKILWTPLRNVCFASREPIPYSLTDGAYPLSEDEIYRNDTMIFSSVPTSCTLYAPKSTHRVSLSFSENTPYLCIWKHPDNAAKFICIEPWSSLPNDGDNNENFDNRNMKRLPAHSCEEFLYSFEFSL